jgi:spoIIIJ-associated protein
MKKKEKLTKKSKELVKKTAKELLGLMGFEKAKISLQEKENRAAMLQIDIDEDEILIGNEGEALFALQMILGIMVFKKSGEWIKVYVSVGDYLQERKKRLEKIAVGASKNAKEVGETIEIPGLNPAERRIVHIKLAEDKKVETESVGSGYKRVLLVKPIKRNEK